MKLIDSLATMIKRNSTTILSSTAITGVATTAYLASRATLKAAPEILEKPWFEESRAERVKRQIRETWKFYIPAAASGVVTSVCIIGVAKVGNRRAMAAQAAFVLTERAYSEYRDKVIEEYGEKKDLKIRDSIAEDRVRNNPPKDVLVMGSGHILCCELHTGRYFPSDIETLKRSTNELNATLLRQDQVSMEEWYYMIGLDPTSLSSDVGWTSDKLMDLKFTSVLTPDGRPCLAFDYNYFKPLYEGIFK